jgi:hypothetical protein
MNFDEAGVSRRSVAEADPRSEAEDRADARVAGRVVEQQRSGQPVVIEPQQQHAHESQQQHWVSGRVGRRVGAQGISTDSARCVAGKAPAASVPRGIT